MMKAKPVVLIAVAIGFAVGMISCGGSSSTTSEQPAAGAPAAGGGTAGRPEHGGLGDRYDQARRHSAKMKVINMAAEPACAKVHTTPAMTEDVVPGDGGTLQNVIVYLKGDFSQYKLDVPTTPVDDRSEGLPVFAARPGPDDHSAAPGRQFRHDHA